MISSDFFPAEDILITLDNNSRLSLLFYDACRDALEINVKPKGEYSNTVTPKVGSSRTKQTNDKATGYMIFYASAYGEKAYTGNKSLSPFTQVLANHLTDGDEFRTTWKNIKNEVKLLTNNMQDPTSEESYENSYFFNPNGKKQSPPSFAKSSDSQKNVYDEKSIVFKTNVPNATIDFYGKKYNVETPLLFKEGSSYIYTIEADGYEPITGKIEVTSNTPSSIDVVLTKSQGSNWQLTSVPSNSKVYLDERYEGQTPLDIQTTSGYHSIRISHNGYYEYNSQITLNPGNNTSHISLTKRIPWFRELDKNNDVAHFIGYSFSPKYQIGLDYLYRFEESRFSLGARIAVSSSISDFFKIRQNKLIDSYIGSPQTYSFSETINGVTEQYTTSTTYYIKGLRNKAYPEEYSEEIDPYNEATHHDADLMFLINSGFNLCNGLLAELGLGAAVHFRQYYMPCYYKIQETVTTNDITGEIVGEPEIKESRILHDYWFKVNRKWSPAMRVGLRTNIPTKWDNFYLSIGGGYTYLFTNNKYSSWDGTIGLTFTM